MRYYLVASLATVLTIGSTNEARSQAIDIRPAAGAFIPTGDQLRAIGRGAVLGVGVGVAVHPMVSVVANASYITSSDQSRPTQDYVSIAQFDIGAEGGLSALSVYRGFMLKPYGGLGIGMRRYSPTVRVHEAVNKGVGYAGLGVEIPFERGGLRLGARANMSKFEGFDPDATVSFDRDSQKLDFSVELGVRVRIR
jgi:hypothetical protein